MLFIIKLGGSVITHKNRYMKANEGNIKRLAVAIAKARKLKKFDLIIVHGAGSFGHMPAKKYGIKDGIKTLAHHFGFAFTHHSCDTLSTIVSKHLLAADLPIITIKPISVILHNNKKIKKFNLGPIKTALSKGFIPMLRGDVVFDEILGGSISSGDEQVPYLAKLLKADAIIYCTDVDGIYDSDPKTNKHAKLIKNLNKQTMKQLELEHAKTHDVTGGMKGKMEELINLGKTADKVFVINGSKPERLTRILTDQKIDIGTTIQI